jgi:hypothetical protein
MIFRDSMSAEIVRLEQSDLNPKSVPEKRLPCHTHRLVCYIGTVLEAGMNSR